LSLYDARAAKSRQNGCGQVSAYGHTQAAVVGRLSCSLYDSPADIEKRLDLLAKRTGRTRNFYVRQAILRHLEDLEDYYLARRRLSRNAARVTLEELEREVAATR
jgi:RHH-type transcriptional regulator, rel operon repressor / antitoxin RelB